MVHKKEQLEISGEIKIATEVKLNPNYSWIFSEQYVCTVMGRSFMGSDGGIISILYKVEHQRGHLYLREHKIRS